MNKLSPKVKFNSCKFCNNDIEDLIPNIILSTPKKNTTSKIVSFYPKKYSKKTNSLF